MEFSKYIVPIYKGDEFSGTGFIVDGMLVTAFHVVKDKSGYNFIFDNTKYEIKLQDLIVLEMKEQEYMFFNRAMDLFVCKTEINNSDLQFGHTYSKSIECEYHGFSYDETNRTIMMDDVSNIIIDCDEASTIIYGQNSMYKNCFSSGCALKHGNSGGPLFQDGKIVGMLIKGKTLLDECISCTFIKASYIMDAIEYNLTRDNENV